MIKTDITLPIEYDNEAIALEIKKRFGVEASEISDVTVLKRTLDLSCDTHPRYKATVAFSTSAEREEGLLKYRNKIFPHIPFEFEPPLSRLSDRPVVVGFGPSGIFAALTLALSGAKPIVLERGLPVSERIKRVESFNRLGILDTECNVQFGEGGAGTYSDGKLKVGGMDKYKMFVLTEFILAGASPEIAFSTTAHLGTDKLSGIVEKIREKIVSLGGEVIFSAKLTDIKTVNGKLVSVEYEKDGEEYEIATSNVIMAVGHSAKDTVEMLYKKGLPMVAKGFGIGVRFEHPREHIDSIIYKGSNGMIPESASYHLVTHLPSGRSVYSFCMCPGGTVVAASSEREGIVTNGMSEYARMADNSNAAILVSVTPEDFGDNGALAGMEYQRKIERAAYSLTGSYKAPVAKLGDFLEGRNSDSFGSVLPSYPCGTEFFSPDSYLPDYITSSIRAAVFDFDEWLPGYNYADALLTGPETRTTSPVRIIRSECGEVDGFSGVYPAGEGAGYSGGIVSSAVDGIKIAEKILAK